MDMQREMLTKEQTVGVAKLEQMSVKATSSAPAEYESKRSGRWRDHSIGENASETAPFIFERCGASVGRQYCTTEGIVRHSR
jgi:hypothetical protein